MSGQKLTEEEFFKFISALLLDLSRIYKKYKWVMLWYINCLRNNNLELFKKLGSDIGTDSTAEGF
ncbi:hypothetical protein P344_01390 [Spiroplasma mirum ATCC 29335]|uniref:Uncharacterized protein n=1 Tax=Spiroplasma mirum ATCC 29335 TaxID=838561 RepID=W6AK18_9MOLU|nr:hypothetical protein P344_01390 [Spiroplasma mirum ATCC 29335]